MRGLFQSQDQEVNLRSQKFKYVGMACMQGKDDVKVKVNIATKNPISASFFTLECNCSVKRCRDRTLASFLHHPYLVCILNGMHP